MHLTQIDVLNFVAFDAVICASLTLNNCWRKQETLAELNPTCACAAPECHSFKIWKKFQVQHKPIPFDGGYENSI